jgi:4-amino-4-deoxy-L-arabinose transferase-like glycosyltransferase
VNAPAPFPDLPGDAPGVPAARWRPGPVFWIIAAGTLLRAVLAAAVPLTMDEAYHVDWARHLQPGYLDHPPAVAWLMALPVRFCGTSTLCLRLPALVLQTVAVALAASMAGIRAGERGARAAALGLQAAPVFFAGGAMMLPDASLLLAWVGTFWALQRATDRGPWWFLWAGPFLGLGALSKLTAGLLGVGVLLALVTTADGRRLLRTPWPWIAGGAALAIASPMLLWNAAHGWPSFTFQANHGLSSRGFSALRLLASVGGQLGYVSPILLGLAAVAGWRGLRERGDALRAALAYTGLPLALFFTWSAAMTPKSLPHWPAPAWLSAMLLLLVSGAATGRWWRRALWLGFGESAVAVLGLLLLLAVPFPGAFSAFGHTWAVKRGPLDDLVGWREGAAAARAVAGGERLAVSHWMHLGQLGWYDGRSPAYLGEKPSGPTYYDPDPRAAGRPLLVVTVDEQGPQPRELERRLGPLQPAGSYEARQGDRHVRTFRFFWWRPPA